MIDETPVIYMHEFICFGYVMPDIPDAPACFVPKPIPISLCVCVVSAKIRTINRPLLI